MNDASEAIDRIRHTELAAARRVQEARDEAEAILARARAEAGELRSAARRSGREEAQRHLEASIASAEEQAEQVRLQGEEAASLLIGSARQHVADISAALVTAVLAPPVEEGK
ncbi:MAG: hypothetical protein EHM57_02210 [Actinobacteria bacterium]|nr:MAG: hypothetical protein EHM57_02210 [Actinomycetota bacterium]